MTQEPPPLLRVQKLSKQYRIPTWFAGRPSIEAIREIDLEVATGTTLAIVGESGSGKSTLARCIAGLERADSGAVWFEQTEITRLGEDGLRPLRSQIQLILQHSAGALNPRFTAGEAIDEPLLLQARATANDRSEKVARALKEVGLAPEWGARRVLQFSGGQRQRLSIARALVLQPRLLILDEALTGLDLSIQAQILDLLLRLQREHALTYLFISHDLEVVGKIAHEIAVMYRGRMVERASAMQLLRSPQHEYTKSLLSAQALLSGALPA